MSNTRNSNLAREARSLQKSPLNRHYISLGQEHHVARDACIKRLKELGTVGVRYGNHRKMYSKLKVAERRSQRRVSKLDCALTDNTLADSPE